MASTDADNDSLPSEDSIDKVSIGSRRSLSRRSSLPTGLTTPNEKSRKGLRPPSPSSFDGTLTEDILRHVAGSGLSDVVSIQVGPGHGLPVNRHLMHINNLHTLVRLRELDLSHNRIGRIENLGLCQQLRVINLSHNAISSFDVEPLEPLRYLQKLDLSANQIERIPKAVQRLISLQILLLEDNKLHVLRDLDYFRGLTNLIEASFRGNEIYKLVQYRSYAVFQMASLGALDGTAVTAEERQDATARYSREEIARLQMSLSESKQALKALQTQQQGSQRQLLRSESSLKQAELLSEENERLKAELLTKSQLLEQRSEIFTKSQRRLADLETEMAYLRIDRSFANTRGSESHQDPDHNSPRKMDQVELERETNGQKEQPADLTIQVESEPESFSLLSPPSKMLMNHLTMLNQLKNHGVENRNALYSHLSSRSGSRPPSPKREDPKTILPTTTKTVSPPVSTVEQPPTASPLSVSTSPSATDSILSSPVMSPILESQLTQLKRQLQSLQSSAERLRNRKSELNGRLETCQQYLEQTRLTHLTISIQLQEERMEMETALARVDSQTIRMSKMKLPNSKVVSARYSDLLSKVRESERLKVLIRALKDRAQRLQTALAGITESSPIADSERSEERSALERDLEETLLELSSVLISAKTVDADVLEHEASILSLQQQEGDSSVNQHTTDAIVDYHRVKMLVQQVNQLQESLKSHEEDILHAQSIQRELNRELALVESEAFSLDVQIAKVESEIKAEMNRSLNQLIASKSQHEQQQADTIDSLHEQVRHLIASQKTGGSVDSVNRSMASVAVETTPTVSGCRDEVPFDSLVDSVQVPLKNKFSPPKRRPPQSLALNYELTSDLNKELAKTPKQPQFKIRDLSDEVDGLREVVHTLQAQVQLLMKEKDEMNQAQSRLLQEKQDLAKLVQEGLVSIEALEKRNQELTQSLKQLGYDSTMDKQAGTIHLPVSDVSRVTEEDIECSSSKLSLSPLIVIRREHQVNSDFDSLLYKSPLHTAKPLPDVITSLPEVTVGTRMLVEELERTCLENAQLKSELALLRESVQELVLHGSMTSSPELESPLSRSENRVSGVQSAHPLVQAAVDSQHERRKEAIHADSTPVVPSLSTNARFKLSKLQIESIDAPTSESVSGPTVSLDKVDSRVEQAGQGSTKADQRRSKSEPPAARLLDQRKPLRLTAPKSSHIESRPERSPTFDLEEADFRYQLPDETVTEGLPTWSHSEGEVNTPTTDSVQKPLRSKSQSRFVSSEPLHDRFDASSIYLPNHARVDSTTRRTPNLNIIRAPNYVPDPMHLRRQRSNR
eukprot:GILJ01010706.1.p1 GENE.GILJ01010706.1~~GILJ01010706.1.p1  ORF type:complete len:1310 (+),score=269.07 GILJ01010706.1:126-4055(+)